MLCMCVLCMFVCMYVHVFMYVCMYFSMCLYVSVFIFLLYFASVIHIIYIYIYIYIYMCVCVCVSGCQFLFEAYTWHNSYTFCLNYTFCFRMSMLFEAYTWQRADLWSSLIRVQTPRNPYFNSFLISFFTFFNVFQKIKSMLKFVFTIFSNTRKHI